MVVQFEYVEGQELAPYKENAELGEQKWKDSPARYRVLWRDLVCRAVLTEENQLSPKSVLLWESADPSRLGQQVLSVEREGATSASSRDLSACRLRFRSSSG